MKSKKFVLKTLRNQLIGFNGHRIYYVHIKKQNQVIKIKHFHSFKNSKIKKNATLPNYKNGKLLFQKFLPDDNDNDKVPQTSSNNVFTNILSNAIPISKNRSSKNDISLSALSNAIQS